MTPEIYWVREVTKGRLAIMPRPRSGDWLRDEISGWCNSGLNAVVSLLEPPEVAELELHDEPALCRASGIEFISFPIPDRGVPSSVAETAQLVERIVALLRADSRVAIHCRAGIGRSSVVAGCVLLKLGVPSRDVFPILSRARGVPVPDSPLQVAWLAVFGREARIAL
jgi:protein-tyrosine phosphatase